MRTRTLQKMLLFFKKKLICLSSDNALASEKFLLAIHHMLAKVERFFSVSYKEPI
jgi:hypothetical protein